MLEKIKGIVLERVRYNDRYDILSLYSVERGRLGVLCSAQSSKKAARMRAARLMPLSVIETEINFKENRELHRLGSVSFAEIWTNIYSEPTKTLIAIFLQDFLKSFLRESPPDIELWDYLIRSLRTLDDIKVEIADFHIVFLIGLLSYSGIFPDLATFGEGKFFDLRTGRFVYGRPLHEDILNPKVARFLPDLFRIDYANMGKYGLSGRKRRLIMENLLKYYAIHLPGITNLKSPAILRSFFE